MIVIVYAFVEIDNIILIIFPFSSLSVCIICCFVLF